ncbi:unnamed protein product [Rotaria sordida]|uniref:FLYWCH-type domain-containing protein n=1 Tax=Rotaria sordida TaxID=392033 RepID=A0A815M3J4_9BILA|nr:unnamed protein product [Rotaria sordida]
MTFGRTNRGGRELYMCGYSYQVKEENATATRWRCVIRTPTCPVTIHTNNIDDSFIYWNGAHHHHPPNRSRELIKNVISKIKARVLVEPYPVVSIAEEEIRNAKMNKSQLAAMPLPSQMESALQKHRRKNIPPLPLSLDFEIPLLYQHTWSGEKFIIADIQRKRVGGRLIMFSSNEQIDLLLNSTTWFCDGTFKTRPIMFAQVYIIQCLIGNEALLPRNQVKTCFKLLCKNSDGRIQSFIEYFKQQWMIDMGPDLWCVADSAIRTNNSSEAYNRRFASRMVHKHPNIWRFIYTLKNEEHNIIQKKIHNLVGDVHVFGATRRKRARQAVKKTGQIIKLHRLFADDKKTLDQLIYDGLVRKCLNIVPQYCQVYPAARLDVSISLEEMITKGFPPNQNIVWHKTTHSQKRYYWVMKPNGDDEVRVRVSGGGIFSKADRDLRILTSTNECRKIIHQFLIHWDKTGVLPGWKTIWTVFNMANYDISERRIKAIHKVIQVHVTREALNSNDASGSDIEPTNDRLSYEDHFAHDNQDDECISESNQNDNNISIKYSSSTTNQVHQNQTEIIFSPSIIQTTKLPTPQHVRPRTADYVNPDYPDKENDVVCQSANIGQAQQQSSNITTASESPSTVVLREASPSESLTIAMHKRKRQRRVYKQRRTPYGTRQRTAITTTVAK